MTCLKIAVADDEPLARGRLSRYLLEAGCEVMAEFKNGEEVVEWVRNHPPLDGLFLDIHMPGATGLEVLAELPNAPPTIFVTAHSEHAVRAFELAAVDYLLKPVFPERLALAIERLRNHMIPRVRPEDMKAISPRPIERVAVKAGEGHVFMDLRKISHFEAMHNEVWAWVNGKSYRTQWDTLLEVEAAFPDAGMLRIQRNLLLRPEAVLGIKAILGGRISVRVADGIDLSVSRAMSSRLRSILGVEKRR